MATLERFVPTILALVKVAEEGSLNRAASQLHVSQSSLTRGIQKLEADLGVEILSRTSHGVILTSFGELIVTRARAIGTQLIHAQQQIDLASGRGKNVLSIGATSMMISYFLGHAFEAFRRSAPSIRLRIVEGNRIGLFHALAQCDIDVMILSVPPGPVSPETRVVRLGTCEVCICARATHPLAQIKTVSLQEVSGCQWILPPPGSTLYKTISEQFASMGLQMPASSIEIGEPHVNLELLLISDAITILPTKIARASGGGIVPLSGDWVLKPLTIGAFTSASIDPSGGCREFLKLVSDNWADLLCASPEAAH